MNVRRPSTAPGATVGSEQEDRLGLERLVFFSDAVFAIAITLLALEIRLPVTDAPLADDQLLPYLVGMWHKYLAYVISFFVIGTFWIGHHRRFRLIKRYDGTLLYLNLVSLMFIAFMPFPSAVISEYSNRTATVFYSLVMMLASISSLVTWWYASRNERLIYHDVDAKQRRRQFALPLAISAVFLISIGLAFLNADLAKVSWLLIVPASLRWSPGKAIQAQADK